MALNFPANPEDGDIYEGYVYSSTDDVWRLPSSVYATESYVNSNVAGKISSVEKAAAFGVATLDGDANVNMTQLEHIVDGAPSTLNTFGKLANQFKVLSTEQWALETGGLVAGSVNVEIDNVNGLVKYKIGDGSHTWADTEYLINNDFLQAELLPINQGIDNLELLKANIESPEFTGNVVIDGTLTVDGLVEMPNVTSISGASGVEISYLDGVTSSIQTQIDSKADVSSVNGFAPIESPTFTGNVTLPYETTIANISSAEINALDGVSTDFSIQYQIDEISSDVSIAQADIVSLENTRATIESPTFTGTVSGITKNMIDLGSVDNTADLNKPISNATQAVLDEKANIDGQVFTGNIEAPNITITGDLFVAGTTTTINTTDYSVRDNMIYLNQAGMFDITNAVGNGTTVTYTAPGHDYQIEDYVVVTEVDPADYNIAGSENITIDSVDGDDFVVTKTDIGTYISGGVARGKSAANPDLGFAAGYNDGTYHHTGFFRDASDGYWKVFDSYTPEPDESPFIDTADPSFSLAQIEVSGIKVNGDGVQFIDGVQTQIGVPSLTTFVYKTASYTLDSLSLRDQVIEVESTSPTTITIPEDASLDFPVGTSIDILQTNTGQVTIQAVAGVTLNGTPGFKLRTRWSSATILKRAANTWIVYGDLTL
jgi:hypothetical protein